MKISKVVRHRKILNNFQLGLLTWNVPKGCQMLRDIVKNKMQLHFWRAKARFPRWKRWKDWGMHRWAWRAPGVTGSGLVVSKDWKITIQLYKT